VARVWADLTNTAHPVVLRPLVELLEAAGHEVVITVRPLSQTVELLEDWGHPYTAFGAHGGAGRAGKARAAASRVRRMVAFGRAHGPFDASIAHGSTDLPVASRLLGIPHTTMLDYEFAIAQHTVNGWLAERVVVPESIPVERLRRFGARRPPKLVRYPGLKEEYVLHGFAPDPAVVDALGVDRAQPLAVVRTAPSYALYLGGSETPLLPRLLRRLDERGVQTVVLTRTGEQAEGVRALGLERVVVPPRAIDARSLVAFADALVSAGGSMNREAAALGTPVWTMFEGRMGGVDEQLIRDGRLKVLGPDADVDQVEVVKRDAAGRPVTTRDPAELLRMALGDFVAL
jgi:predicted glycosyltransferase